MKFLASDERPLSAECMRSTAAHFLAQYPAPITVPINAQHDYEAWLAEQEGESL